VTWPAPAAIVYGARLSGIQLNATATFGGNAVEGSFTYTPDAGTALLAGGGRELNVTFTPNDTTNFDSADSSTTIDVAKAQLTIRPDNQRIPFGAAVPEFSATFVGFVNFDTPANLDGTLEIAPVNTPPTAVGTYAIAASGVSSENYTITFQPGTLTIVKGATTISVVASPNPASVGQPVTLTAAIAVVAPAAGTPTATVQFFDGSTLLGSVAVNSSLTALLTAHLTTGKHIISATYLGDPSFLGSSSEPATIDVKKVTPTVTWPAPADITYGTALANAQLNASADVPGTFSYVPAVGTVLGAGSNQTLSVTFTPSDSANYTTTTASVAINILKATPIITVSGGMIEYDGLPHAATGTATGIGGTVVNGAFSFAYTPGGSSPPVKPGMYAVMATFTSSDANYQNGSGTGTVTIFNTAAGNNVVVRPIDGTTGATPVTLTLSTVTQTGITTLATSNNGPAVPANFSVVGAYYDIHTTAAFSGPVTVCIANSGIQVELVHYDVTQSAWVDVTNPVQIASSAVCGTVSSFSPFALVKSGYTGAIQPPMSATGTSVFNMARGVVPVRFTLSLKGVATCQLPPATLEVYRTSPGGAVDVNEADYTLPSDSGSNFRTQSCQYVYNLVTGALGSGSYVVQAKIGGIVVGTATFGLR